MFLNGLMVPFLLGNILLGDQLNSDGCNLLLLPLVHLVCKWYYHVLQIAVQEMEVLMVAME